MNGKFIHCADLHLGTAFKGIGIRNVEWMEVLTDAPIRSFERIIDLAVAEQVELLAIAGDVFDDELPSLKSRLAFRAAMERLDAYDIRCFIAAGNHDPYPGAYRNFKLPDNVHIFKPDEVESIPCRDQIMVSGISHGSNKVTENLAVRFEKRTELFHLAVLHGNIGSAAGYEPYAPAALTDLIMAPVDYWALGHIHDARILCEEAPRIVYSGSTQGHHVNQSTSKGCFLVNIGADKKISSQFHPTAPVGFTRQELALSGVDSMEELERRVVDLAESLQGEQVVLELLLTGATTLNGDLRRESDMELLEVIRSWCPGRILVNDVVCRTRNWEDLGQLTRDNPLAADVVRSAQELRGSDYAFLKTQWEDLRRKFKDAPELGAADFAEILDLAENELLSGLTRQEEGER